MGNTCASVHIALTGKTLDAIDGIARAYKALGFEQTKTPPPEGGKHVIVFQKAEDPFLSLYDSDNALLDSGELKELALAASKIFKAPAICTSLYDSDTFEMVVFNAGKQIDLVTTDPEQYSGPLKILSDTSRATQWSKVFGKPLSAEDIKRAATIESAFADDAIAALSQLIGLTGGQSQSSYQDLREEEAGIHHLHFTKGASARAAAAGQVVLRDYFDPDNSRMLLVYPASWPAPLSEPILVTWLLLSEGAGFKNGTLDIRVTGPDGLTIMHGYMEGAKFHNGQMVGPLETAPREAPASIEEALKAKQFTVSPGASPSTFVGRFSTVEIPTKAPDRPTQILMILQLQLVASRVGEWTIEMSVRPSSGTDVQHVLPRVAIAAVEQTWLPVVTGLNPKASYEADDLATAAPRGPLLLQEVRHKQVTVRLDRSLNHFAIASNVVILPEENQATLDACRAYFEAWLRPLAERTGEVSIHAEKRMTAKAYVGKTKKALPASTFQHDKVWHKLFDMASTYQTVLATVVPQGAQFPIAGIGLQVGLEHHDERWREHHEQQVADTLRTMRGRSFDRVPIVNTVHLFHWVLNHDECYRHLGTSIEDMKDRLDAFASRHPMLQAWHSQYTWRPMFDHAYDYHRTAYEDHSVLNWFRGILPDGGGLDTPKMSLQWCSNVLRMVTPHMWICRTLLEQVDRPAVEAVAEVTEANGAFKIVLREGRGLDDLELAMLAVLPVESARLHKH